MESSEIVDLVPSSADRDAANSSTENARLIEQKSRDQMNGDATKQSLEDARDTAKSSKFNDRQMRGRLAVDENDRCSFFVHRKKRTCRMMVKPGKRFCGEHATQEVGEVQQQQQQQQQPEESGN